MKKITPFLFLAFFSCKKEAVKIEKEQPVIQSKEVDTQAYIKAVFNYSTSITNNLSPVDLQAQSVDTTYVLVYKNGVLESSWKCNWGFNVTKSVYIKCDQGDVVSAAITHVAHRNIKYYFFSGELFQSDNNFCGGTLIEPQLTKDDPSSKKFTTALRLEAN